MSSRVQRYTREGADPPAPVAEAFSRVIAGDVLEVLGGLPGGGAQTVVTSPPYWGLRDYDVPPSIWGGDSQCLHRWRPPERSQGRTDRGAVASIRGGQFCVDCAAWKGCLGLEPDPDLYVDHLVEVMRAVRRCLRPDGTLWLNLGDCFAARGSRAPAHRIEAANRGPRLKAKDLVGIPWRVAFALQADGWWLRAENIWNKPNAMPESVGDRPTRAHEYVFLLSPSARYFYDSFAVREADKGRRSGNGYRRPARLSYAGKGGPRGQAAEWVGGGGRNRRSVWTIATQCFRDAHFATFPEALVEVCVLAGSSPAACGTCGAPWSRMVESRRLLDGREEISGGWSGSDRRLSSGRSLLPTGYGSRRVSVRRETLGWRSGCEHDDPSGRCVVLDPFAGSGTVGVVAGSLGRDFVGAELSSHYVAMARSRIRGGGPGSRSPRGLGVKASSRRPPDHDHSPAGRAERWKASCGFQPGEGPKTRRES